MPIGTTQKVRLQFRYGTKAKVVADTHDGLGLTAGEPYYATDTTYLYLSDGTQIILIDPRGIVTNNNEIVVNNGEVVIN